MHLKNIFSLNLYIYDSKNVRIYFFMHTGCLRGRCSDLLDECKDLSSEEITADAGSPGKDRQTTRRPHTSTMMYTQGGKGKNSGGSCPGSLEDCVALCPSEVGFPKNSYISSSQNQRIIPQLCIFSTFSKMPKIAVGRTFLPKLH